MVGLLNNKKKSFFFSLKQFKICKIIIYYQSFSYNFFIFFISYFLYYLSLEKCLFGIEYCSQLFDWINKKLYQAIASSFILIVLFEFIIVKRISKFHFIHFFISFSLLYMYSYGNRFNDHGLYNFYSCIGIIIIGLF